MLIIDDVEGVDYHHLNCHKCTLSIDAERVASVDIISDEAYFCDRFDPYAVETDSISAFLLDDYNDLRHFDYGGTNDNRVAYKFRDGLVIGIVTNLRQSKWKKSCLLKKVSKQCSVKT